MVIALTIINIVALIAIIVIAVMMYQMLSSFAELMVKFIEQNQEYYKNQKHLLAKSNDLVIGLKKIPNLVTNLKRASIKIDTALTKKE